MKATTKLFSAAIVGGLALIGSPTASVAADISGAGSTFVFPILSKWAATYKGVSGVRVNYQSIGSGGGIKQIESKTVTFGASDMPLPNADLTRYGLIQFPLVNGADVPVVNVRGVSAGQLVLDGPTLAGIFMGKISNWSDPAIKKLNPGVAIPNQSIAVVHRSDGSGTTFIWTNYLAKVSPEWKDRVGVATAVDWPVGIGAKGNEGVAGNVAQTPGSIGYVEYAYAKQNGLKFTRMINSAGKAVEPNFASFQAAVGGADWARAQNFNLVLTNAPGEASWPIAGSTWAIMYKQPANAAETNEALKFFKWGYANGKAAAQSLDYVPLPDNVAELVEASWKQIQGWNNGS